MLRIHQPYIKKKKVKYFLVLASIGALLLGSGVIVNSSLESSVVYAAGESRTLSEISTMQEMTQQICSNSEEGETNNLLDSRGGVNNYYKVIKMLDGTCWMGENLRLPSLAELTPNDSDVTSDYTLPGNSASGSSTPWVSSISTAHMADGAVNMKVGVSNSGKWKEAYGNYYSWCAATAMSCLADRTGNVISDEDAKESICPRGWKLPAGTIGAGSFQQLYDSYPNSLTLGWVRDQEVFYNRSISNDTYNGLKLGIDLAEILIPSAGAINSGGVLNGAASYGCYWTRMAGSDTNYAYYLDFTYGGAIHPQYLNYRYNGFPVRCVAAGGLKKIEKPMWEESKDGNVTVNVPSTLTIDAASGMEGVADAGKVIEGTATATISSNTAYSVTLHANQPELKDVENTSNSAEISVVSDTNPVEPGYNAWGFWDGNSMSGSDKLYTVPISTIGGEYYNSKVSSVTDKGNTTVHTYYVGISISPSLPSGTYGTEVTITASAK